jgi:hypothetical protein
MGGDQQDSRHRQNPRHCPGDNHFHQTILVLLSKLLGRKKNLFNGILAATCARKSTGRSDGWLARRQLPRPRADAPEIVGGRIRRVDGFVGMAAGFIASSGRRDCRLVK